MKYCSIELSNNENCLAKKVIDMYNFHKEKPNTF